MDAFRGPQGDDGGVPGGWPGRQAACSVAVEAVKAGGVGSWAATARAAAGERSSWQRMRGVNLPGRCARDKGGRGPGLGVGQTPSVAPDLVEN